MESRPKSNLLLSICVATILAALVTWWLVTPRQEYQQDMARRAQAITTLHRLQVALQVYKTDTGTYPNTAQGLGALRVNSANDPRWFGPYVQVDVANDPWGHPYVYKYPGDHGDEPDIMCYGADGQPGGTGRNADIVSWQK
jgi:general secretion pathway protein G